MDAKGERPARSAWAWGAAMLAAAAGASLPPGWEMRPDIPSARQELGVEAIAGDVWAVGGITPRPGISTAVEVFGVEKGEWIEAPPLPVGLHHAATATLDGRLVVVGGFTRLPMAGSEVADSWVLGADGWEPLPPLPHARGAASAVTHGGAVYVFGGAPRGQDAYRLSPGADSWETLPPMPTGRNHAAAVSLGGRIYVVGGRNRGSFTLDTVEAFNPTEFTWEKSVPMPTGRSGHAAAAVDGCLHVFGGEGNRERRDGIFPQHELFDPFTGEWTALADMPAGRHGIEAAVVGRTVFLPGGGDLAGLGTVSLHDAYTPPAGLRCSPPAD